MGSIDQSLSGLPIIWRHDDAAAYDDARIRRVFNHRRPKRFPVAVVQASTEQHIVDAVNLARQQGCRVSVRSGGHSWAAWSVRDNAILIDLGRFHCMDFDEDARIIRVSPSTTGRQLNEFLGAKGYFFPGGHCPDVGLGGFLLQGGMGWNCKNWGWACENIQCIDVVTAAGERVRCSSTENQELFWMARGGGPGFPGVVVAFHLRVRKAPLTMLKSFFAWPMSRYREVMNWVVDSSRGFDEGTEIVAVSQTMPGDSEPSICALFVTFADSVAAAEAALNVANHSRPDGPIIEEHNAPTSISEQYRDQAGANPEGHRYSTDNAYLENDADVATVLEEAFTTLPSPKAFALYYAMHPVSRRPLPDMALSMQSDHYFAAYTIWEHETDDARCQGWLRNVMQGVERSEVGAYLGDSDFQVRRTKFWADENATKLKGLRNKWDPDARICGYLDVGDTSGPRGLENRHEWRDKDADCASGEQASRIVPVIESTANSAQHTQPATTVRTYNHNINHIGLSVSDLDAAVAWYSKHFGFRRLRSNLDINRKEHGGRPFEMYKSANAFKIAFLASGNGVGFELFQFDISSQTPSEGRRSFESEYQRCGYFHMGITTVDPERTAATACQDGACIVGGPIEVHPGEKAMFIQDPWGNVLELCSNSFEATLANRC